MKDKVRNHIFSISVFTQKLNKSRFAKFISSPCIEISDDEGCDLNPRTFDDSKYKRTYSTGAIQIAIGDRELHLQRKTCSFNIQNRSFGAGCSKDLSFGGIEDNISDTNTNDRLPEIINHDAEDDLDLNNSQTSSYSYNLSQESLVISDDEINYSMNKSRAFTSALEKDDADEEFLKRLSQLPSVQDNPASPNQGLSTDSIEISDDELDSSTGSSESGTSAVTSRTVVQKSDREADSLADKDISNNESKSEAADIDQINTAVSPNNLFVISDDEDTIMLETNESQIGDLRNQPIPPVDIISIDLIEEEPAASQPLPLLTDDFHPFEMDRSAGENDFINESIAKMFEDSFNYKEESVRESSTRSSFRKTKSAVFPDHRVNLSFDGDCFGGDMNTSRRHSPFKISNTQISDQFDILVNGGKRKSIQKSMDNIQSQCFLNSSRQMSCDDEEIDMSNENYVIKVGGLLPKPNFEQMGQDEILEGLKKNGLKLSLNRRQAIICLEHIYNRTHPYIEHVPKALNPKALQQTVTSIRSDIVEPKKSHVEPNKLNYNKGFSKENIVAPDQKQVTLVEGNLFLPSNPRSKVS